MNLNVMPCAATMAPFWQLQLPISVLILVLSLFLTLPQFPYNLEQMDGLAEKRSMNPTMASHVQQFFEPRFESLDKNHPVAIYKQRLK